MLPQPATEYDAALRWSFGSPRTPPLQIRELRSTRSGLRSTQASAICRCVSRNRTFSRSDQRQDRTLAPPPKGDIRNTKRVVRAAISWLGATTRWCGCPRRHCRQRSRRATPPNGEHQRVDHKILTERSTDGSNRPKDGNALTERFRRLPEPHDSVYPSLVELSWAVAFPIRDRCTGRPGGRDVAFELNRTHMESVGAARPPVVGRGRTS